MSNGLPKGHYYRDMSAEDNVEAIYGDTGLKPDGTASIVPPTTRNVYYGCSAEGSAKVQYGNSYGGGGMFGAGDILGGKIILDSDDDEPPPPISARSGGSAAPTPAQLRAQARESREAASRAREVASEARKAASEARQSAWGGGPVPNFPPPSTFTPTSAHTISSIQVPAELGLMKPSYETKSATDEFSSLGGQLQPTQSGGVDVWTKAVSQGVSGRGGPFHDVTILRRHDDQYVTERNITVGRDTYASRSTSSFVPVQKSPIDIPAGLLTACHKPVAKMLKTTLGDMPQPSQAEARSVQWSMSANDHVLGRDWWRADGSTRLQQRITMDDDFSGLKQATSIEIPHYSMPRNPSVPQAATHQPYCQSVDDDSTTDGGYTPAASDDGYA